MKLAALLFTLLCVAGPAFAASDGDECTPSTTPSCSNSANSKTFFLAYQKGNGSTSAGPVVVSVPGARFCTVNLASVAASCTLTAITVQESHIAVAGGQTIWHTLGTFSTGTGSGPYATSSIDPLRPVGPGLFASWTNPADADCDGGSKINVTYTCFY